MLESIFKTVRVDTPSKPFTQPFTMPLLKSVLDVRKLEVV